MMDEKITPKQAETVLLLLLLSDLVTAAQTNSGGTAADKTLGIMLGAAGLILLSSLVRRLCIYGRKCGGYTMAILSAALFMLKAAAEIKQADEMYYVTQDTGLAFVWIAVGVLGIAWFVGRQALQTIARTGSLLLILFTAAAIMMLTAAAGNMRVYNLSVLIAPCAAVWQTAGSIILLLPDVFLFYLICEEVKSGAAVRKSILLFAAVSVGTVILAESIMGADSGSMRYPMQMLSRLDGISVFRRIAAFVNGVWLLFNIYKSGVYFKAAVGSIQPLCGQRASWAALAGCTAAVLVTVATSVVTVKAVCFALCTGILLMLSVRYGGALCIKKH